MKVPPRPFFVRALPYWFALIVLLFSLETGRSVLADVTLAWNPNPDPTVAGYRLHAGTASGVYNQVIEVGNATATAVSNLAAGKTYYFVVTAYTAAALESGPSNEIAYKTPPAPTLSISASDHTV